LIAVENTSDTPEEVRQSQQTIGAFVDDIEDDVFGSAGINFTNILRAAFLYESALHSFSLITVWLCNFLRKEYCHKMCL